MTHDQYNQLFEAIVQLTSEGLITVDSEAGRQPSSFPADSPGTGES